jgi:hypothetical protein
MYIDVVRWFGGWRPSEIDYWAEVTIDHVRRLFVRLQDLEYAASYVTTPIDASGRAGQ